MAQPIMRWRQTSSTMAMKMKPAQVGKFVVSATQS
jgi:hypothetical protein